MPEGFLHHILDVTLQAREAELFAFVGIEFANALDPPLKASLSVWLWVNPQGKRPNSTNSFHDCATSFTARSPSSGCCKEGRRK